MPTTNITELESAKAQINELADQLSAANKTNAKQKLTISETQELLEQANETIGKQISTMDEYANSLLEAEATIADIRDNCELIKKELVDLKETKKGTPKPTSKGKGKTNTYITKTNIMLDGNLVLKGQPILLNSSQAKELATSIIAQ